MELAEQLARLQDEFDKAFEAVSRQDNRRRRNPDPHVDLSGSENAVQHLRRTEDQLYGRDDAKSYSD
jgi:hypothetical protein